MEQPTIPKPLIRAQSSILSFFQPRSPNYAAPPSATNSSTVAGGRLSAGPPPVPIAPKNTDPLPEQRCTLQTSASSTSSIPQQARISAICENHIQPLKRINTLLLPINYPESFYNKILDPHASPSFSRVILWQDPPMKSAFSTTAEPKVVGGMVCRLEIDEDSRTSSIYIQSLALLSPYRSYGLAAIVLEDIISGLLSIPATEFPITSLYAHVWTENHEGLGWYTRRGFTREEPVVQGYYRRLQPGNAWIVRRALVPSDHLRQAGRPNRPAISQHGITTPSPQEARPNSKSASPTLTQSNSTIRAPPKPSRNPSTQASSYQTTGPGHEWNDLPAEILSLPSKSHSSPSPVTISADHLQPGSGNVSAASSRSSSSSRAAGKKKRQYPAAAFGTVNGAGKTMS